MVCAVVTCASAAVEYSDIQDTAVSASNTQLAIDFIGAGQPQFDIAWSLYSGWDYFDIVTRSSGTFSPWVAGGSSPTAFDLDDVIGDASGGGGYRYLVKTKDTSVLGNWADGDMHYVGVRFTLDDGRHYGWVQAQYDHSAAELTVFGYAYETTPETPIIAGAVPEPTTAMLACIGALTLSRRARRSFSA